MLRQGSSAADRAERWWVQNLSTKTLGFIVKEASPLSSIAMTGLDEGYSYCYS
jgi:hypothetical protein